MVYLSQAQQIRVEALKIAVLFHKTPEYTTIHERVEIRKQIIETAINFVPYITDGVQ